ncbi:DUF6602 domain-containing protein [Sorangium sp. So ce375]|uniref:DUF6602 domain-containing protein n=1 Tax=Sorangium sp. So ce375 TaxID=3133306 RepID=UPI003F5C3F60
MVTEFAKQRKGPYHQVYLSHVERAIAACRTVSPLQHSGEKGRIREILLRSMFRPLLPSDLGVGTGFVVGAAGEVSTQQDIVLYDRSTLPPALFDPELGIFPIESVLHTIEVKSVLSRQELLSSHQAAKALASLMIHDKGGNMVNTGPRPCASVFALDTDLTLGGKSEIGRYAELLVQERPRLSAFCVVGRGYWWLDGETFRAWPERYEFSEVIGFIGGILNSLPHLYDARRTDRPPFGAYLMDFGADLRSVLRDIGRLGDEVDALRASGTTEDATLMALQDRFRVLSNELDEVFAQYQDEVLREGYQKARTLADGVAKKIAAAAEAEQPNQSGAGKQTTKDVALENELRVDMAPGISCPCGSGKGFERCHGRQSE